MQPDQSIVVLTAGGLLPAIIINAVIERFGAVTVLREAPVPLSQLFRNRLSKLGVVTVAGQVGFGVLQRLLAKFSERRRHDIVGRYNLNTDMPLADCTEISIGSVNSDACRAALTRLQPRAVLVVGTRMIGRATLSAITAPVINYHAGINPAYRGMCGGYWALASADPDNFGVTAHLVDAGVDTGGILHWATAPHTPADNFATYPLLLAAAGRDVTVRALEDALAGRLNPAIRDLPSGQWYHPTLWGYLWTGLRRGVW